MNNLEFLLPQPSAPADVFRFGVVTGVKPLRVRLDGDVNPTAVTPIATVGVANGDRVFVQIHNRQLMVVGRVGGFWGVERLAPGENLNNYDKTGSYHQPLSADAGSGTNYPAATAGLLEVTRGDSGGQIFQRYTNYLSATIWTRTRYNGTWNSWKVSTNEDVNGKASMQRLRLTATDDASETSTMHPFQIGPDDGVHIIMDPNEIIALATGSTYGNFTINGLLVGLQGRGVGTSFAGFVEDMNGVPAARRAGMKNSGGTSYFQVEGMWTTTNAANCYVNTSGTLYRSTSVRAAKLAIEDIKDAQLDALEKLRVRTWFDKRDAEQLADDLANGTHDRTEAGPLKRQAGVVAEEIEELGLEAFLLRGEDGQLEGVAYDRLGVAAIPLIRRQSERINELEKRLARLEQLILKEGQ